MIYILICVISHVWLAGRLLSASLSWQKFNIGYYVSTFQPNFHTCHACRHIDFYHFTPLSLTLTFTEGQRVQEILNLRNLSVAKRPEVAQTFTMVNHVMEMTSMKFCKYGDCGPCEHLLF